MLDKGALLGRMSRDLGMLPSHLDQLIQTAPLRYKMFEIPKKSGGMREVAQPAREVKAVQRWLVSMLSGVLPVHPCATAYRLGSSIKENAEAHRSSRYMVKLDFSNFFPSITKTDIELHLAKFCGDTSTEEARALIAQACSWARKRRGPLRLCIGAPSSPLLSNSIMFDFDEGLERQCKERGVSYTRYADDITLSSRERGKVEECEAAVVDLLAGLTYPRISLNEKKTVRASRADKRVVTGLVLTPEKSISIGRDRKRLIRAMYHHSLTRQISEEKLQELNGFLAFAEHIEPGFVARLKNSANGERKQDN